MSALLQGIVHVTKYQRFKPGILGPVTGFEHKTFGSGVGKCNICRRTVVRGEGRWWE